VTESTRIAELRPADLPAAAALHARGFPATRGERPWTVRDLAELLGSDGVNGFLIPGDEMPCAMVLLRVVADEAEILTLAVDPNLRRRGLAMDLMRQAIAAATAKGARRMFLEVAADNEGALRLYRRLGFVEVGRRRLYYRRTARIAVDAITMSVDLPCVL
jgi:ribosomal-protein-alanine N-acetyltransferase